jgi:hypothetical protein
MQEDTSDDDEGNQLNGLSVENACTRVNETGYCTGADEAYEALM